MTCLMHLLLQLLNNTIKMCLIKAAAAGMTSIAFPTIGCGRLGYDPCDVADCFVCAQRDSACQLQVRFSKLMKMPSPDIEIGCID